jgi:3-oxoacyl-[acyl-carrier protein] reductase
MIAAAEQLQSNSPSTVVNLSSVAAARGGIGRAAYNASKAAVESISRTAAVEWASAGVTVNAISPGFTETPLLVDALHTGTIDEADLLARIPAGRLARTAEIADLVVFLASSAARYITGQTIVIDGGFLIDYGVGFKPGMTTERGPREG